MSIYNLAINFLFWTLFQTNTIKLVSINSLSDFKSNFLFLLVITVVLFSIAGVPPFLGFFSKILILTLLLNTGFFALYVFFFILLFFALYFYLQNLRFLYSTVKTKSNFVFLNDLHVSSMYSISSIFFIFNYTLSFITFDDIFFFFYWLLH